jgi:putative nucleotidyltransferase with HDIG domain
MSVLKVAGYISSSMGSRVNKTLELKIQQEEIESFCKERGFTLVQLYVDQPDTTGGKKINLDKLVEDAKKKKFERIIVFKFDRLTYDKNLRSTIYRDLVQYSVDIFSLSEKTTMKDPLREENKAKINIVLRKVKDIPSLPEIVNKVMELVSNPRSSAGELSNVIEHDPGLTTKVLRMVNSAYYGFPKQISSVQQAIMILGFTTMRGLVLSTSIFKIFTPKDSSSGKTLDYKEFWKHSITTALNARIISENLKLTEIGDAFSCGILHDIGKIVLDQYDHTDYVTVFKKLGKFYTSEKMIEAEEEVIGINHADIGYRLADKWNLPANLSETMRCHHNPLEAISYTRLVCVVYIANIFANIINKPYFSMDISKFDPNVLVYMGIDEEKLFSMYETCKNEIQDGSEIDSFFE